MSKEVIIGDCRLIHADSRDVEDIEADMVCSDPPYLIESGGNTKGEMGGKFAIGTYDNSGSIVDCDITWAEIWQVIKNCSADTSHIYCMVNNRNILEAWNEAVSTGFHFHNILMWDKVISTPNRWYMKDVEFTLFFKLGPAYPINDCGQNQLIKFPHRSETNHPTEKPIELMANYIRQSTKPGQIVCDPFMGSGTTIIAAAKSGRKAVGIESNEEFFRIACERLEKANDQPNLFEAVA